MRKVVTIKRKLYVVWFGMKERCLNPKSVGYKYYGAKGIGICDRWMDFNNFYLDTNSTYQEGLTIDRKKSSGHYGPDNFKWSTMHEQNRNRSANIWIEFEGERKILADWAAYLNVEAQVISRRLNKGMAMSEVIKEIQAGITKDGKHNKGKKYGIRQQLGVFICAYCGETHKKRRKNQRFCTPDHKRNFKP